MRRGSTTTRLLRAWFVVALVLASPIAAAAQNLAALARDAVGLPMKPQDAAGPWVLQSAGQVICTLVLSGDRTPSGVYPAVVSPGCGAVLPPGVVGWKPVTDGMALVDAGGRLLVDFNQWTPRDLAARRPGGPALELTRPKS